MAKFLFCDDKIINILVKEEKPSGGAAVQAYGWIKGLSEAGEEVDVLTCIKGNEPLKEDCASIRLIPWYDNQKGVRWIRWVYYRFPYMYKKVKEAKPDYLYQGIPSWQSFLVGIICQRLRIKFVMRISNDFLLDSRFYAKYSRTHKYFQRLGMKMSYCILCQNEYQYNIIRREFPNKKVVKISNPFFLKAFNATADITNRKYIAWLGLYQYQKNVKLLYEIALLLKDEQFLVCGKEDPKCDRDTLYYLDQLKQLPNVTIMGFLQREQILPFLSKAKFLLNTSHYEGFSNTFLEAMSVGTPILSSSNVNPDEIITKYQLGIIYKDPRNLLEQLLSITPQFFETLSFNTRNYVYNHHDYKLQAKRLIQFLKSE